MRSPGPPLGGAGGGHGAGVSASFSDPARSQVVPWPWVSFPWTETGVPKRATWSQAPGPWCCVRDPAGCCQDRAGRPSSRCGDQGRELPRVPRLEVSRAGAENLGGAPRPTQGACDSVLVNLAGGEAGPLFIFKSPSPSPGSAEMPGAHGPRSHPAGAAVPGWVRGFRRFFETRSITELIPGAAEPGHPVFSLRGEKTPIPSIPSASTLTR